jgi:hypothetical protein
MTRRNKGRGKMDFAEFKAHALDGKQVGAARDHRVLIAKPVKESVDPAELRRELMRRFSKTLAYLAK